MRRLVVGLCATLIAGVPVQSASAAWQKASSKHFIIYSDEKPDKLKAFADKLERFDAAVRYLRKMQDPPLTDSGKVTIFLLPDDDAIMKLTGSYYIRGLYTTRASGSYAFVPRNSGRGLEFIGGGATGPKEKNLLTTTAIFFHEYAHHLQLQDWTGVMPMWVTEGFAEFFATTDIDPAGNATMGKFPGYRSWEVFLGDSLSAEELVSADYKKLTFYEGAAIYGRSWLLMHYLTVSGQRKGQLSKYLDGIESGMSAGDSARAAFGDLKALDRELKDYLKPRSFLAFTVDGKVIPIGETSVQPLSAGANAIMDVMMRSKLGVTKKRATEVVEDARRIAAGYPADPFVQDALAEAEADAENFAASGAAADRALAVNPNDVHALIYKGRAEAKLAAKNPAEADWDKVRGWFTRANKADTENAEPLMLFYDSYAEAKQAPTKNAVEALLYAADLAPRDFDLRMKAVRRLLIEKRIEEARQRFAPAAYAPHAQKEWQTNAQAVMKAIDDGEASSAVQLLDQAVKALEEAAKKRG